MKGSKFTKKDSLDKMTNKQNQTKIKVQSTQRVPLTMFKTQMRSLELNIISNSHFSDEHFCLYITY